MEKMEEENLLQSYSEDEAVLTRLMQWDIPDADQVDKQKMLLNDAINSLLKKHRDTRLEELLNKSRNSPLTDSEKSELSLLTTSSPD